MYDEYVYNAIALLHYLVYHRLIDNDTVPPPPPPLDSARMFDSLHGPVATHATHNVRMYFSLWDFDPADGLFHPTLEQADPPLGPLYAVRGRVVQWPHDGGPPPSDYCAFNDCSSTSTYRRRCLAPSLYCNCVS